MTSEFDMSRVDMPYGVLHDQKLSKVTSDNNKMIFTFDIEIYPQNYTDDFYKQYEDYKHCDMIVEMQEEPFNYFQFVSCPGKNGKFKGLDLGREEFIDIINNASSATFVECSATYGEFRIELCVNYYNAKNKYKRYKKYGMCYITLDAKKIIWNWY
ncbi:MAG: hypothetical protein ACI4IL_02195 [Eubacterium sp.]